MRRDILLLAGFALGLLAASVYRTSPHTPSDAPVATANKTIPLGVTQQQLLDAIAAFLLIDDPERLKWADPN